MKNDTTYNGWTNYETWRVNLELFDGDGEAWRHGSSDGMREFAEQLIEESTDEGIGRAYAMAFLQDVNWQEIAEHYEQEEEVMAYNKDQEFWADYLFDMHNDQESEVMA